MKTADLSDSYPESQICESIFQSFGGNRFFHGPVRTIKCVEDFSLVKKLLSEKSDGEVLVVDAGGSRRCAMLGDILAEMGVENGWAGGIFNGMIRDSADISTMPFGVKALGTHPRRSNRDGQGQENIPVKFAGVTFTPGDFVYADEDGILVSSVMLELR